MLKYALALICLAAIPLGTVAHSEPITQNLESFRALVPDYSPTSGGVLPAVNKSGSMLVFRGYSLKNKLGDFYLLSNPNNADAKSAAKPAEITFKLAGTGAGILANESSPLMDWSPDGKRLAIAHYDGCLYVVDNIKQGNKTTVDARILAKPSLYKDEKQTGNYYYPKWSPDGKKIAVLTIRNHMASILHVIDVESGKSTILADDVLNGPEAWSQPWSPDSTRIVYASAFYESFSATDTDTRELPRGIRIVSIDGATKTRLKGDETCYSPSWSATSGKIAFVRRAAEDVDFGDTAIYAPISKLCVADENGNNEVCIYKAKGISDEKKKATADKYQAALRSEFKNDFGSMMSKELIAKLDAGEFDRGCLSNMAFFYAAKKAGGPIWKLVSRYETDLGMKDFLARMDSEKSLMDRAVEVVPKKEASDFMWSAAGYFIRAGMVFQAALPDTYERWVWAPDETRIACVRRNRIDDSQTLLVVNARTGYETEVCSAPDIQCASWMSSNTLIAQVSRLMSRRTDNDNIYNSAGYPEVWMLTLK